MDRQRAELRALVARVHALGLNAIVFHVRPAADALYPTSHAPWSAYLTGASGVGPRPTYDPLADLIAEAHARGIQVHAWANPFRAGHPQRLGGYGPTHVVNTHPRWVRSCSGVPWIDPGIPDARRYVLDGLLDLVDRYDVDGLHLDDYFYCYPKPRTVTIRRAGKRVTRTDYPPFPDEASWREYGRGWTDRDDWRRANIDQFIEALYRETKARKAHVLVGIRPFGIWRPGHPAGMTGFDAFTHLYADARRWWREGWLDYLAPQLYWPLEASAQRFRPLDQWWRGENAQDRHLWPGLFTRRVADGSRSPWALDEIPSQIQTLRAARARSAESDGHIHFRLRGFWEGATPVGQHLRATTYRQPALVPPSPWLAEGDIAPAPQIRCHRDTLTIEPDTQGTTARWWVVHVGRGRATARTWSQGVWRRTYRRGVVRTPEQSMPQTVVVTPLDAAGRSGRRVQALCAR